MSTKPTAHEISELIDYDPNTGIFRWKVDVSQRVKAGEIAGGFSSGYRMIKIKYVLYKASRIAFLLIKGKWPKHQIDHVDHDRSNDKWSNLRSVTSQENNQNRTLSKRNISGVMGVGWYKPRRKWRARICVAGEEINLGYFHRKRSAIIARKSAEIKYGFHPNHGSPV